ncbi:response regulator [candidate division KSB1 bacterium]|nr:response regulator [candidate division KSB1 bacterium]
MYVLLVEDDRFSRKVLQAMLERFGCEVTAVANGADALREFVRQKPDLVLTDWLMPELDGITLCKRIREYEDGEYTFVVMVSAKNRKEDVLEAMEAGVDDFLAKPFHREELRLRLRNAERILNLQHSLAKRISELEEATAHVERLQGFLPICAYCKNVRNDGDFWQQIEHYIAERAEQLFFSHSICPQCYEKHVKPMEDRLYGLPVCEPTPVTEDRT